MRRNPFFVCLILGAAALSGCSATGKPQVASLSELAEDDIIVVGSVTLDPELEADEQQLAFTEVPFLRKKFIVAFGSEPVDITDDRFFYASVGAVVDDDGDYFFLKESRSEAIYYSGTFAVLTSGGSDKLYLPGGVKYAVAPDAKAVYVGDFRYERDAYDDITDITLENNYDEAAAAFRRQFGDSVELVTVEPTRVD